METLRHESEFASRYREVPRLSTYLIVFNIHHGPLSEERLRHEIVQALDVDALVRRNVGRLGIPAHGLIPPGLLGYEPKRRGKAPLTQEQDSANIELAAVNHSLYEGPYSGLPRELFGVLEKRGIQVRIERTKAEQLNYAAAASSIHLSLTRWAGDYPDADTYIDVCHSERGLYGPFCGTPEMDRLCEQGRAETRPELRHDIYQDAEQLIARRALMLPLFHEQTYRFARPEVEDFEVSFTSQTVPYEKLWLRR